MIAKQKAQVFLELGLKAELTEDGVLMEVAKVFPGARSAGRTTPTAPAPSRAAAPLEYDDDDQGPFDDAPPPRQAQRQPADPSERDWRAFMDDSTKFYDDLDSDKPRIKRKGNPDAKPLWLNTAPQWVKDWATENGIQIPAPPRQGGGGGGGRTGGGGSYRR